MQPFALAGVGFINDPLGDIAAAWVFGAGTNLWLWSNRGLRVDFRVPLGLMDTGGATLAVGAVFRIR